MIQKFITKLDISVDTALVIQDLKTIIQQCSSWEPYNQIGLRHRLGSSDQWKDSAGGLYDRDSKVQLAKESDFQNWNDNIPVYTKSILEDLALKEGITWGRIRFMRSMPKTGLSMHTDDEPRYHLVLWTNPNAIFGECYKNNAVRSICYHLPSDSHWYKVDTTREHFVYNGGWAPRVHLVCCPII
jgi:Aspartyl/Asparaginyl beta-hydroxylase